MRPRPPDEGGARLLLTLARSPTSPSDDSVQTRRCLLLASDVLRARKPESNASNRSSSPVSNGISPSTWSIYRSFACIGGAPHEMSATRRRSRADARDAQLVTRVNRRSAQVRKARPLLRTSISLAMRLGCRWRGERVASAHQGVIRRHVPAQVTWTMCCWS